MKDLQFFISNSYIGNLYIRLQLSKPFLVRKWRFIKRPWGWNLHLFPIHFYFSHSVEFLLRGNKYLK